MAFFVVQLGLFLATAPLLALLSLSVRDVMMRLVSAPQPLTLAVTFLFMMPLITVLSSGLSSALPQMLGRSRR